MAGASAAGLVLYLADLVPFARDLAARRSPPPAGEDGRAARALDTALRSLDPDGRLPAAVRLVDDCDVFVLCEGAWRPEVHVSTAAVSLLGHDELRAALAHEIVHARMRDGALGWGLMAARSLMCYNPFVQLAARAVVHETERRADRRAADWIGDPKAMALAVVKLAKATGSSGHGASRLLHHARIAGLEPRCRALLAGEGADDDRRLRLWLASAAFVMVFLAVV